MFRDTGSARSVDPVFCLEELVPNLGRRNTQDQRPRSQKSLVNIETTRQHDFGSWVLLDTTTQDGEAGEKIRSYQTRRDSMGFQQGRSQAGGLVGKAVSGWRVCLWSSESGREKWCTGRDGQEERVCIWRTGDTSGEHPRRPAVLINLLGEMPFCYCYLPASGNMIMS